jgi:hypothetical protein
MLNDEHLLMTWEGTAEFEDGTRQPIEYDITVGAVRQYAADPDPCQCDNCLQVFPPAIKLLALQEDHLAGKITAKQVERELKRIGYRMEGRIQHH